MKIMTSLVAGVFVGLAISSAFAADQNPMVMQKIDLMPLAFTQNNGQWDQPVFAQIDAGRDQGETAGRSIREFLTPEGRFDLEAARRSGYQGPLDMRGFETALDTSTGQPVFRAASPASPTDNPDDIYWDNSISPSFPGMNDFVRRLTVYDGKLIAAGNFAIAGGVAANYIASWDGSSWSSLGSGMNEWVYDLTVYDGKLIAGGIFTIAGGVGANYIASWDGSSWSPLGLGMNGSVLALTVYDGRLIAGGDFTSAGGVAANYIASWDGSSWSPLGSGMNGDVFTVTVYKGHLIAGGNFLIAGNKVSAYLAAWTLILDADSDGVADVVDNCTEVYNPDQTDTDHDGIGDACDLCTDTDHDGFGNPGFAVNTCPTDNCPNIFNPDQMDADGDGIGAECDNCPFAYDPNQEDADHDGKGDSCDVGAVAFTASPRCGGAPLTVAFTDQSAPIHTATSWLWDFGDGHSGTGQILSHEYNDVGVFDVMLIVSNGSLGDTLIKSGYITTQVGLTADFTGIPNSGKSPLTVVFEPILQGIANEYLWDFGDGETSTVRNPIHTYAVQGMYDVKLIARLIQDGCDQVDTITKEGYVVVNDLIPAFRATPLAGVEPLTVQFTDESQGSPLQFYWEFGDGQSSTDQNPVHQYVS